MNARLIAALLGTTCASASAQTPGLYFIGPAPGMSYSVATALSADGVFAVGTSVAQTQFSAPGFIWTAATGRYDFGFEPGMPARTDATGISSDGQTIVGIIGDFGATPYRAYRRLGNGPLEDLGTMGYLTSFASGVSGDGNIVVGMLETYSPQFSVYEAQAFRWTPSGGMQGLGWLGGVGIHSEARAISRDGSTIVGQGAFVYPFVWRESTGMQLLPPLPGAPHPEASANGVNADGNVIVGRATNAAGQSVATRWTSIGVEDLGLPAGADRSFAFGVSDDGLIVGGSSRILPFNVATVWTVSGGATTLADHLDLHGISVPLGWRLEYIYAVSGDGLTFAGEARSPAGIRQGFVATVPAPAGLVVFVCAAPLALRRRRRGIQGHKCDDDRCGRGLNMRTLTTASAAILVATSVPTLAQTPGLYFIGPAPGMSYSVATALSADGVFAVGTSVAQTQFSAPGFIWTAATGRYDFGFEPGMPARTDATGISSDGQTIVGIIGDFGATPYRAYRRLGNGPLEDLGTMGYLTSFASGVSGDGNIVVGMLETYSPQFSVYEAQAFRWTPSGGMQGLGWLGGVGIHSEARAISRDGSTIVGQGAFVYPFVWRESTGMQQLPAHPGATNPQGLAAAANADGSVIVGSATNAEGRDVATRWTTTGIEELSLLPGAIRNIAFAVSDDGLVVGGSTRFPSLNIATVWTPGTGAVTLTHYLSLHGISVPSEWRLEQIYAISGDGLTFAGEARSPAGIRQGFVATVPAPAGLLVFMCAAPLALRRRRGMR
jgi:probable HAF family extracellular repeat protein